MRTETSLTDLGPPGAGCRQSRSKGCGPGAPEAYLWGMVTPNTNVLTLERALAELEAEKGIISRPNFMCCRGCSETALAGEFGDDVLYVYWTEQDDEGAFGRATELWECPSCEGGTTECSRCHGEKVDPEGGECADCYGDGTVECADCQGACDRIEETDERDTTHLRGSLHLAFTPKLEVGRAICAKLEQHDFSYEWHEDTGIRIEVLGRRA